MFHTNKIIFNVTPDDNRYIIGPAECKAVTKDIAPDADILDQLDEGNIISPLIFHHANPNVKIFNGHSPPSPMFTNPEETLYLYTYWYPESDVYITYDRNNKCIRQIVETAISRSDDYILYHFSPDSDKSRAVYIEMTDNGSNIALISGGQCEYSSTCGDKIKGASKKSFSDDDNVVHGIQYYKISHESNNVDDGVGSVNIDNKYSRYGRGPGSSKLILDTQHTVKFQTGYSICQDMPSAHDLFIYYVITPNVEQWIDNIYNPMTTDLSNILDN